LGAKPPWAVRFDRPLLSLGDHEERAEQQEDHDRGDLDRREPELELAVGAHGEQVGAGQGDHQAEGQRPQRRGGDPVLEQRGAATASTATTMTQKYQYIHPVRNPASPTQGDAGVLVEGADLGLGGGHLAEHAHHEHDEQARDQEGDHRGRSGRLDHDPAADEQPRSDHSTEGDHRHVTLSQAVLEPAAGRLGSLLDLAHLPLLRVTSSRLRDTVSDTGIIASP
jgi:hypothetical protein